MKSKLNLVFTVFNILDRKQKINSSILFVLCVISIFFDLFGIGMVIPLIAIIINEKSSFLDQFPFLTEYLATYQKDEILIIFITFFLIFYLFKSFFSTFLVWFEKKFIHYTHVDHGKRLLFNYLSENYLKFIERNSSSLIRNIIFETGIFVTNVISNLIHLSVEVLLVIGITCLLIYYEPVASSISITVLLLIVIIYISIFKKKLSVLGKKRQVLDGNLIKNLTQAFSLYKEIRLFDKSNYLVKKHNNFAIQRANISIFEDMVNALPRIYFEFLALLGLTLIIFYFVYFKNSVSDIIPVIGLYAASTFRLIPCATRIIGSINSLNHNLPAFDVIYKDLAEVRNLNIRDITFHKKFEAFIQKNFIPKSLRMKNIEFSFFSENKEIKVLNKINIEINSNLITGLVGETGSGKSTLANIISGLITEYKGEYLINENSNINKKILQKMVGHVPQHTNLIDDSILNNICFGIERENIDFDKVKKIINKLKLSKILDNLPNGLDSKIGEQGLKLSGGQRQKIALARTLYLEPRIIIFDESTSSLDKYSEEDFIEVVKEIKKDKIIIFISHNVNLARHFEKIYKMENSQVIQVK